MAGCAPRPILDLEVALEEVDHRPVTRRLAVRDRGAFKDEPALQPMRVGELVDEARLAHSRFADERRHLPVTGAGKLLGAAELLQLSVAADEARQAAPGGRLQAGPRRARPPQLIKLPRAGEPPYPHGAPRLHLHITPRPRPPIG